MKFFFVYSAFFFISLTNNAAAIAQKDLTEPFTAQSDSSGEETIREIEYIAVDAKNTGERLYVIARLGKTEKLNQVSLARLAYARTLLLLFRKFPFETAIFAVGDRAESEGRIEFYLGSRLRLVTLAKRNRIPNLTCCPDYSPPTKNKRQKKKDSRRKT